MVFSWIPDDCPLSQISGCRTAVGCADKTSVRDEISMGAVILPIIIFRTKARLGISLLMI